MTQSLCRVPVLLLPVLLALGCSDSNRSTEIVDPPVFAPSQLAVTANTTVIAPSTATPPAGDLGRVGVERVERNYRVTTPAGEPFSFDVVTWREGTVGEAKVAVAHVRDGVDTPADASSLAAAGVLLDGTGLTLRGDWIETNGDGLARMSVKGRITEDQVIAVSTYDGHAIVIEIAIGSASEINPRESGQPDDSGVVSRQTIYSSDAMQFGIPTVAVSGDRTSIVCYEGDRSGVEMQRYEMRLQHDAATSNVTGGGSVVMSETGCWRDHEIAALHNVLAVVRSETTAVDLRLSFDRGATFAQTVQLPVGDTQSRLVQVAMAADYTLAAAFWSTGFNGSAQLLLVEGGPVAFDATGSPTWFEFGAPEVLHSAPPDVTPLTTGIAWSDGGDLVIGYGFTQFVPQLGFGWRSVTEFRCAVRHHGEEMEDRLVDLQEIFGMDPTVAVLGSGDTMRVFYAYEVRDGVRLAVSEDGGVRFSLTPEFGEAGDHLPSVFARVVNGETRVDVLYLASRANGTELHRARWTDWPASPRVDEQLTRAKLEQVPSPPNPFFGGSFPMTRCTQVSWLGYDAAIDGDEIVVAYDETTSDNFWWLGPIWISGTSWSVKAGLPPTFSIATPPPLAPGMTEPVPPVDAEDAHQLVLMRLR